MLSELDPFNLLLPSVSIQLPSHFLQQNADSYNHGIILALIRAVGGTTAQAASHRFLNAEAQVRSRERAYDISGQSSTETGFSTNTSLYPTSITLPKPNTRISFIYHRRYIILPTDCFVKHFSCLSSVWGWGTQQ